MVNAAIAKVKKTCYYHETSTIAIYLHRIQKQNPSLQSICMLLINKRVIVRTESEISYKHFADNF